MQNIIIYLYICVIIDGWLEDDFTDNIPQRKLERPFTCCRTTEWEEQEEDVTLAACRLNATRKRRRRRGSTSVRCNIGVSATQGAASVRFQYRQTVTDFLLSVITTHMTPERIYFSSYCVLGGLGWDTGKVTYLIGRLCVC